MVPYIIVHMKATNDTNGNPRRLYVIVSTEEYAPVKAVVEEGYSGIGALDNLPPYLKVRNVRRLVFPVRVTPGEYQETKREAKKHGIYIAG